MKLQNGMETSISELEDLSALVHVTHPVFLMATKYRGKTNAR